MSSCNFFQKTKEQICFLEEVLAWQFCFKIYWPLEAEPTWLISIWWFLEDGTHYHWSHGLRTTREEIAFTARPKIHSHSQVFRYGRSIFCLPHQPNFSDIFDFCLHWVSVVRDWSWYISRCGTHTNFFSSWWSLRSETHINFFKLMIFKKKMHFNMMISFLGTTSLGHIRYLFIFAPYLYLEKI